MEWIIVFFVICFVLIDNKLDKIKQEILEIKSRIPEPFDPYMEDD